MPRITPLRLFLALTAVLAFPAPPVPNVKQAADDWIERAALQRPDRMDGRRP